jgi:hypothetical protein
MNTDGLMNRVETAIDENRRLIAVLHMTRETARIAQLRLRQHVARRVAELQAIREQLASIQPADRSLLAGQIS